MSLIDGLLTRKGIVLVVIPCFTLFAQGFIRYILDKDWNTIGITLGALGLGQLLPFVHFDHFIANKVLGISPDYRVSEGKLSLEYNLKQGVIVDTDKLDKLKNLYFLAIFLNLALFMIVVYLGICGYIYTHIFFGAVCCVISWYLLIFKNDR